MSTNVQAVINGAADEADSLLEGIANPAEAKPVLLEWLADNHSALTKPERLQVVAGVLSLLAREGFFSCAAGGDESDDPSEAGEPDE
jgi:hypothetical protein